MEEVSEQTTAHHVLYPGLTPDALSYWVAFNRILGIGPVNFRLLLDFFQDNLATAWKASDHELTRAGLSRKTIDSLRKQQPNIDPVREIERLTKHRVGVLTWRDADYPPLLREIPASPPVLYIKGTLTKADQFALAVVGTRSNSTYGQQVTEHLVGELARGNVTTVSGLALGIDTIAHNAALNAGGRTIAVLACGLDIIYPSRNRVLAQRITESEQGALLSEYAPGMRPESGSFPARNRIISGISQAVLIVEAGEKSGALITASFALKQGREVFAVPGTIFSSRSRGTNKLIADGARPVTEIKDILEALNLFLLPQQIETQAALPENAEERTLLHLLNHEPVHVNDLIAASNLSTSVVAATLTMLELKGLVKALGGSQFMLAR